MNEDLISRSALLEQECFMDDDNGFRCSVVLSTDVRRAPAVDPEEAFKNLAYVKESLEMAKQTMVPVRHGRWVVRSNTKGQVYCSECGTLEKITDSNFKSTHCPNCGAKMDGDFE